MLIGMDGSIITCTLFVVVFAGNKIDLEKDRHVDASEAEA